MEMIEKIASVAPPKPPGIKDKLLQAYFELGKTLGYSPVLGGNGACLAWKKTGDEVAFEVQFGNRQEFIESMRRLFDSGAGLCVLATSSAAHTAQMQEIAQYVEKNFSWGNRGFLICDLETGKRLLIGKKSMAYAGNAKKTRRKRIFGRKGEHKAQD